MTENSFCYEGVVAKFQPQKIHCDVSEHSVTKVTPDTNRYFRYYICLPYPGIYLVSLTMMDLMNLEYPWQRHWSSCRGVKEYWVLAAGVTMDMMIMPSLTILMLLKMCCVPFLWYKHCQHPPAVFAQRRHNFVPACLEKLHAWDIYMMIATV